MAAPYGVYLECMRMAYGVAGLLALGMVAGCSSAGEPRPGNEAASIATSDIAPPPEPTPAITPTATTPVATATLDPSSAAPADCESVDDEALTERLAATILPPRNAPEFAPNGVVTLRTQYEGEQWTYVAARLGPNVDGEMQMVATWALSDADELVGLHLEIDNDDDGGFELEVDRGAAFAVPGDTGPYFWNNDKTRAAECALNAEGATVLSTRISRDQYDTLAPSATTLDELYDLVGDRVCEESSQASAGGIETLGLTCRGEGAPGANAVLLFQDGVLVSKAQAGL